ncbi:hypothetical protein GCM10009120_07810 [Sphingobacterium siyangense subsp. cladoniae]|uniref:DUF4265 domain-containing protein n=1 Tax=Sphingobacterium siyangense TaxID=459529 RepID=UPI0031F7E614
MENNSKLVSIRFYFFDLIHELESEDLRAIEQGQYYRIKSLSFFVQGIGLDDIVAAEMEKDVLTFQKVITPSGNSTLQITVFRKEYIPALITLLERMNCYCVTCPQKHCMAVNVPVEADYNGILKFLNAQADKGILHVKLACISPYHRQ